MLGWQAPAPIRRGDATRCDDDRGSSASDLEAEGIVTDIVFFDEWPIVTSVPHRWCNRNHPILSEAAWPVAESADATLDGTIQVEVDFVSFIVYQVELVWPRRASIRKSRGSLPRHHGVDPASPRWLRLGAWRYHSRVPLT